MPANEVAVAAWVTEAVQAPATSVRVAARVPAEEQAWAGVAAAVAVAIASGTGKLQAAEARELSVAEVVVEHQPAPAARAGLPASEAEVPAAAEVLAGAAVAGGAGKRT